MLHAYFNFILIVILLLKLTYQDDIIGFYQSNYNSADNTYTWSKCSTNCYTCNKGEDSTNDIQNCLSCNPKQNRYLLDGDLKQNCYKKNELPDNSKTYILDTKQTPNKWVQCHENCKTCSGKATSARMNCIECKDGYMKVNTNCYQLDISDSANLGFKVGTETKHCGDFLDDETNKQLGIFDGGNKCIIKPDTSYFPQNNKAKLLKNCQGNCAECEGIPSGDDEATKCLKCKENYINYNGDLNDCRCPNYYGVEEPTNNCVNCKYSPYGPYNLNGKCVSSKEDSGITYKIINTTYNILSNCDRPCLDCDSGRCKTCAPNYFLNKIALIDNTIVDNKEICLTYKECLYLGIEANVDFSECKFCDSTSSLYKLYNQYACSMTITDVENSGFYYLKNNKYHALGKCHERCKKCRRMPRGDNHQNCDECKDSTKYQLNSITQNCDLIEEEEIEEEEIKCQDTLFYIDEGASDDKIKCIEGDNLCPEEYQYLVPNLRMCVKENKYDEPLSTYTTGKGNSYINDIRYDNSLDNDDKYERIIILKKMLHFSKNLDYLNGCWGYLDNKIKSNEAIGGTNLISISQIFNDYLYKYIFSEDSTFHFTTTKEQNNFIFTQNRKNNIFLYNANSPSNYIWDTYGSNFNYRYNYETYRNTRKISIIYLSECEKIIKRVFDISLDLYIMKLDIYKDLTKKELTTNKISYRVYNPITYQQIDLDICKNYPINIITPVSVSSDINSDSYKMYKILLNVKNEGYEPFIVYSDFYTKTCNQYKSEKDSDMNLKDRKKYIYDIIKKYELCQRDCYYRSTDDNINFINCICIPKDTVDITNDNSDITNLEFTTLEENNEENYKNVDKNKLLKDINESTVNDYFNFYLMKCFKLLFSYDGFIYNYLSMIIIGLFVIYLLLIFFYLCTGFDSYLNVLKEMLFHKFLYREYWRIKKLNGENINESNIPLEEDIKEKETNINKKKIQNRTNTKNVFERNKKFKPNENNKWIRMNKSSTLVDPIKDDQIQPVNEYAYKENAVYKNINQIRDYKNDIYISNNNNKNNPPKRNNNNYYHMEKNNDLINARTVKPITSSSYDDIQALVDGKQKSVEKNENIKEKNNNEIDIEIIDYKNIDKKEGINYNNTLDEEENNSGTEKNKEKEEKLKDILNNNNSLKKQNTNLFNKKSEMHNTSPAIYIYNLMLGDYPEDLIDEEVEKNPSKIITKREYSFLNDGEINELDYDNCLVHDKRNIIRLYYSYLKYNCVLIFSFFVYEDFNLMLIKYALFINYIMFYLVFNTAFFNNNTIHNVYINDGDYVLNYHWRKILLAFILSLICIKLIKWWITFYRRRSLHMKLLKRYTDTKNEILKMIQQYYFHLRIFFPIFCALFILFWYYVSTVCAVFRYSYWQLIINWVYCACFHLIYSIVLNIIPTVMRYYALKKEGRECLFTASRICSYFF